MASSMGGSALDLRGTSHLSLFPVVHEDAKDFPDNFRGGFLVLWLLLSLPDVGRYLVVGSKALGSGSEDVHGRSGDANWFEVEL